MDPFLRSKIRSGVSEVLLEMKEAKLTELKIIYSELEDIPEKEKSTMIFETMGNLSIEKRLLEAEISILKRTVSCYSGSMGPL
jgi:hypothetical protein